MHGSSTKDSVRIASATTQRGMQRIPLCILNLDWYRVVLVHVRVLFFLSKLLRGGATDRITIVASLRFVCLA